MKKITLQITALVILGSVAYMIYAHAPRIPDAVVSDTLAEQGVPVSVVTDKESTAVYTIDIEYPQFGIAAVDERIKMTIGSALAEFKSYPANPPESATPKNELFGTYSVVRNDAEAISVRLSISEYTGGAHPNTVIISINMNPKTGAEITLDDALSRIGLTLSQVSEQSLGQLKSDFGEDIIFPDGAAPRPENYATFLIGTSTVTFVFQSYQVTPYAAGIPETVFPIK